MRIAILSDTHDLLRPEVIASIRDCGAILHGGDISSPSVLERLRAIAPVTAVRGNNDREWAAGLPLCAETVLGGLRVCMAHKKKDLPQDLSPYDLAVCGHTHQYVSSWLTSGDGHRTLLLNPGSCGPRRFRQPITLAILTAEGGSWTVERVDIPHTPRESAPAAGPDIRRQIGAVMRETDRGVPVDEIARRHGMDPGLTEQIARLYVTHPGVTEDGIMAKMGL